MIGAIQGRQYTRRRWMVERAGTTKKAEFCASSLWKRRIGARGPKVSSAGPHAARDGAAASVGDARRWGRGRPSSARGALVGVPMAVTIRDLRSDALHSRIQGRNDGKASHEVLSTAEAIVREDAPTYHPWGNVIERLWKVIHDSVPRNHHCRSMCELCQSVPRSPEVLLPFSGNAHRVAHMRSAI